MDELEFRLYYDDNGDVLFYSCEQPEGDYIVIDATIYAECRHDLKIFNGAIVRSIIGSVYKLVHGEGRGIACASEDKIGIAHV